MTTNASGIESFLSIGEGEAHFAGDSEFLRLKAAGALRIFDPFDPTHFEPRNAALVIRCFALKAHDRLRASMPAFLRFFFLRYVDRCALTATISEWEAVPTDAQRLFRGNVMADYSVSSFTVGANI